MTAIHPSLPFKRSASREVVERLVSGERLISAPDPSRTLACVLSDACRSGMCRKSSGHFWASDDAPKEALTIEDEGGALRWYASFEKVRRGFCGTCGSQLFWDPDHGKRIGFAMGALEKPTGLKQAKHIFVTVKVDYYEIADGLPQGGCRLRASAPEPRGCRFLRSGGRGPSGHSVRQSGSRRRSGRCPETYRARETSRPARPAPRGRSR